jgi:hypothetical protein
MSKRIFASGYFSMDKVVQLLVDDGHEVLVAYESIIEGTTPFNFGLGIPLEGKDADHLFPIVDSIIENLTIGGKLVCSTAMASAAIQTWVVTDLHKRQIVMRSFDRMGDLDAVLLHSDNDATYGPIGMSAKRKGIPVFTMTNGFCSNLSPKYCGKTEYLLGHRYCLGSEYVLEHLADRGYDNVVGELTGFPSFDCFYSNDVEREPNTFLYNPGVNYSKHDTDVGSYAVSQSIHPWAFLYKPSDQDIIFFKAFAKYQAEVNPEAKLVVTLRPYYLLSNFYSQVVEGYGVKNVEVHQSQDTPFRDLVQKCEYFISGISTVVTEGIISRTPTVFLCGKEPAEDFFKGRECYVESVIREDAIVEALHYTTSVKQELIEACNDRASYYNYGDDGKASERILQYIYDTIN